MKLVKTYNYIDGITLSYINNTIENDNDFDEERFENWFMGLGLESKRNPSAYLKVCFKNEYEKGTFKKLDITYVPSSLEFVKALKDKGIKVMPNDSLYINVLYEYLLNVKKLDIEDIRELNYKVINYLKAGQTFEDYKESIKNSNTLKPYNIDWVAIDVATEKGLMEWDRILTEIEAVESEATE